MNRAEHELRLLKRQLLLTRAAAERAQFVDQLDSLDARTRSARDILGFAFNGTDRLRGSGFLSTAAAALRFVRRQPWLIPVIVKGAATLARSSPLRLAFTVGAAALGAWWLSRSAGSSSASGATVPPDAVDRSPTRVRDDGPSSSPHV